LTRDATGAVIRDPNREVQDRIALVFTAFLEQGSVGKVMRTFAARGLRVPRRDRFGEVAWRPVTLDRINRILQNPAYAGAFVYGGPGPATRCIQAASRSRRGARWRGGRSW